VGPTRYCGTGTPLWSVSGYITSSWFVWIILVFAIAFVWKYVYCITLCLIFLLSCCLLTCVHDSPAHLYMPQLFIHQLLACHHLCCVNYNSIIVVCMIWHLCFCNICCCYHLLELVNFATMFVFKLIGCWFHTIAFCPVSFLTWYIVFIFLIHFIWTSISLLISISHFTLGTIYMFLSPCWISSLCGD